MVFVIEGKLFLDGQIVTSLKWLENCPIKTIDLAMEFYKAMVPLFENPVIKEKLTLEPNLYNFVIEDTREYIEPESGEILESQLAFVVSIEFSPVAHN